MKGSKLPLYALIAIIALAVVYRIVSPPAPQLPGPIGTFPTWKSISVRGKMTAQATNQAGTMWAGAWSEKVGDNPGQSAIHVIDFNGFSAKSTDLDKDTWVSYLSWADEYTLRALCVGPSNSVQVVYIDGRNGEKKRTVPLKMTLQGVLIWPVGSDKFAALLEETDESLKMAVLSESGKMVGKEVSFDLPNGATLDSGTGVAADGSSFVFALSDPAAKDGKSFYLADTKTGTAKKAFDLGELPGRIEEIWPSAAGILMVCKVREKDQDNLKNVVYDSAAAKLVVQPSGVDLSKWPAAPKSIAFTTYNGGYEFDPITGKTKTVFDTSKKESAGDKGWRDFLRDSRFYKLKNGNYVIVSETGGAVDIREVKPDGEVVRALLSRM